MFGLLISGISNAAVNVPSICEIIKNLKENHPDIDEDKCNDVASMAWNMAVYSGESIGPILGGYITKNYNFSTSCVSVSLLNLSFLLAFIILRKSRILSEICPKNKIEPLEHSEIHKNEKFVQSYYSTKVHSLNNKQIGSYKSLDLYTN